MTDVDRPGGGSADSEPVDEVARLVSKAANGDQAAWNAIVERFSGRVWAVCRVYRLSSADAADVFQQTWLRVLENLHSLRDPARLGAWIGTTSRYEALGALRRARRTTLVGQSGLLDRVTDPADDPAQPVLISDRNVELWQAFRRLSRRCQDVLRVLVVDADDGRPSYELAAKALGIPVGSLGPTRGRCLAQLRRFLTEGIGGASGAS